MHQLVPGSLFLKQLSLINDIPRANEALAGMRWVISENPDDFPVVASTERLRLVKSEKLSKKNGGYVRLYLWFAISNANKIDLLNLEVVSIPISPLVM